MEENYKTKAVLKNMMKGNRELGKALALPKKQQEVLDILVKHNVTTDINKLKGYEREAFLKDIKEIKNGFYVKKAFHEAYGAKKSESEKLTRPEVKTGGAYDRKENVQARITENVQPQRKTSLLGFFSMSRKSVHEGESRGLIAETKEKNENDEIKERLGRIQS